MILQALENMQERMDEQDRLIASMLADGRHHLDGIAVTSPRVERVCQVTSSRVERVCERDKEREGERERERERERAAGYPST